MEMARNGRTLAVSDPLRVKINANIKMYKERGERYPEVKVDDLYTVPFVFYGHVPYHALTLERLRLIEQSRSTPITLPAHFIIDGESKLPGERVDQYEKYLTYRDMGPSARSLRTAATIIYPDDRHRIIHTQQLASRMRWEERVAAYDAQMEIEARRSAQALLQEQMAVEAQRRQEYLETEWSVVQQGFAVLKEMLKYPVVEKKYVSPDGKTTIWQPGKWTYSAVAQLIDTLTKAGRLHTNLSTSNTASKIDATMRESIDRPAMSGEEEEMHIYASQKAEEAYFSACEEWKARKNAPDRIMITAAD